MKSFFKVQLHDFKMQKLHFRGTSNNKSYKVNPSIKQEEITKIINKTLRTVKTRMIEMQEK